MLKLSETQVVAHCICPICGKNTKAEVKDNWITTGTDPYSDDPCIDTAELMVLCGLCNHYFDIDMLT